MASNIALNSAKGRISSDRLAEPRARIVISTEGRNLS